MTSVTASATSAITSPRRTWWRAAPVAPRAPPSLSEAASVLTRVCSSGARPKTRPVATDTASVNISTSGSTVTSLVRGRLSG